MNFVSVAEIAKKWNVSDRMVRNYCAHGRIPGAFLTGKTWNIPADAVKPERESTKQFSDNPLLNILKNNRLLLRLILFRMQLLRLQEFYRQRHQKIHQSH